MYATEFPKKTTRMFGQRKTRIVSGSCTRQNSSIKMPLSSYLNKADLGATRYVFCAYFPAQVAFTAVELEKLDATNL